MEPSKLPDKLRRIRHVAAVSCTIATVLGWMGQVWWGFELLDHLRVHFAVALLLLVVTTRSRSIIVPLLVNLLVVRQQFVPQRVKTVPNPLTVTHVNIDKDKLNGLNAIQAQQSDLIFVQEVTPPVAEAFTERLPDYDVMLVHPMWNTHGSALLVQRIGRES